MYELKAGKNLTTFEFVIDGCKGKIVKLIQFVPTNYKGLFNLVLGEKDLSSDKLRTL